MLSLLLSPSTTHAQTYAQTGARPSGKAQPFPEQYTLEQVGAWGGEVGAFVKDGNIGYVGAGQRLVVLDMSNLNNLVEIASLRLGSTVQDIKVRDGYAYVVTSGLGGSSSDFGPGASAFHVVDISDPDAPQLVWSNDTATTGGYFYVGRGLDLYGDLALLQGASGTTAADISDPLNPVMLGSSVVSFVTPFGTSFSGFNDIAIQGDFAYIAHEGSPSFFFVYDLSTIDPASLPIEPALVASIPFGFGRELTHVTVEGDWVYLAVTDESNQPPGNPHATELWAIDISDPTAPVRAGSFYFANPGPDQILDIGDLSISNGRLYVSDNSGFRDSLMIFDVATDPSQPAQIGTYNTHGSVYGVVGEGDIAYLFDHGEGLIAVDTTDPGAPSRLGNFHSPATLGIMTKRGDLMYISDYWNGMTILDLSDRTDPQVVGVYQTRPGGYGNAGPALDDDGYAYLGVGGALEVIDVSDPSSPVRVGFSGLGVGSVNALELVEIGDRKVVILHATPVSGCYRLFSLDVTDPTDIVQLDVACTGLREPVRLALGEPGTLYHTGLLSEAGTFHQVVAVDYSDPSALQVSVLAGTELESPNDDPMTAVYDTQDQMLWYTVNSSQSNDDWLHAVDLSDPADPVPAGTTRWWSNPGGMAISPHGLVMLGVAEDLLGQMIILMNTDNPSSPRLLGSAPLPFSNASEAGVPQSDVVADESGLYVAKSFRTGEDSNTGLAILDVRSTVDRNRDGRINTQDLAHFLKEARSMSPSADLNGDGRIDQDDVALFVRMYLG